MTDKDKALVERLRGDWPEILVEKHWMMDSDAIDMQREEAADRIEAQAAEIERLIGCLAKANTQAEHFEREWYLRGDRIEAQAAEIEKLREALLNCPIIGSYERAAKFRKRQDDWLATTYSAALGETK